MAERVERITTLARLAPRKQDAHKGDFGRVLVVGGSRGMIGAPALAANAALRAGAGLVTVAAPETVQLTIASLCPCATSAALACDRAGALTPLAVRQMRQVVEQCDVLAVGPGMGVSPGSAGLVRAALEQERPLVLDADGLNNLAKTDRWAAVRRCPMVLTPHPGEFSRLTGMPTGAVQRDRVHSTVCACRGWIEQSVCQPGGNEYVAVPATAKRARAGGGVGAPEGMETPPLVVVLKGAGTVVTDGRRVYVNQTGNPGMATGGAGDVLTGVVAALIGQGLDPFSAACLGVHIHGLAGDLAAEHLGQVSLVAADLIDFLPEAFKRLQGGRQLARRPRLRV